MDDRLPYNEIETQNEASSEEGSGETMEALLAQQAAVAQKVASREVVWVKVIQVAKDQVLVDIGEKREGVVPVSEFHGEPGKSKRPPEVKPPAAGQRIPVIRVSTRRDGTTLLSYQRAKAEIGWQAAAKAYADKSRVRGQVLSAIRGGFLVDVGGVNAFLPASLADLHPVRNPSRMVGGGVRCYIIELSEAKRQLVLSRKAVLEDEASKRREKLLAELRVGEVRIGRVTHAEAAGLLVDIGGLEGFVRAADVAWGGGKPAYERGAKVKVKVLSTPRPQAPAAAAAGEAAAAKPESKEGERVFLGIKQLTPNPADSIRKKFPPKSVVRGKVVEAGPSGVRFALDERHFAFSAPAECDSASAYKPGDSISAIVLGVNPATFDVTVSINKFDEIRERKKIAEYLKPPAPLTLGQLLSPETQR